MILSINQKIFNMTNNVRNIIGVHKNIIPIKDTVFLIYIKNTETGKLAVISKSSCKKSDWFDDIKPIGKVLFAAKSNNTWQILNDVFEVICDDYFDDVISKLSKSGFIIVNKNNDLEIIDSIGNKMSKDLYFINKHGKVKKRKK